MGRLHALVMAGGPGRRFWPWSTPERPKHALPLLPGGGTLFRAAVDRMRRLVPPSRLWLVTTAPQAKALRALAPMLRRDRIILEPEPRDTAAAIAVAARRVLAEDPGAVMAVVPGDQVLKGEAGLLRQLQRAAEEADRGGWLVVFGVRPDRPATAYGYIEAGRRLGCAPFLRVRSFREKPPEATARNYLRTGRFLWNSGIFVWRADAVLEAVRRHAPDLWAALGRLGPRLEGYGALPKRSIDYAVMEKAPNRLVMPAAFSWEDWGTWSSWESSLRPDREGNRRFGRVRMEGCRDSTAVGVHPRQVLEVSGARGHLVVLAEAGLLVVPRAEAGDLKRLLAGGRA